MLRVNVASKQLLLTLIAEEEVVDELVLRLLVLPRGAPSPECLTLTHCSIPAPHWRASRSCSGLPVAGTWCRSKGNVVCGSCGTPYPSSQHHYPFRAPLSEHLYPLLAEELSLGEAFLEALFLQDEVEKQVAEMAGSSALVLS